MPIHPPAPAIPAAAAAPPKMYFRRGKISAYRDQFMMEDGKPVDGERFHDVKRLIDYTDARWYDAATGEELHDYELIKALEAKYKEKQ